MKQSAYKLNKQDDNIQPDTLLKQFGTTLLFHGWFCGILTCMQVSQEPGNVVWFSHCFKNFPQFVLIHTVKGISVVNEAEVDVFLEFHAFSMVQQMLTAWSLIYFFAINYFTNFYEIKWLSSDP